MNTTKNRGIRPINGRKSAGGRKRCLSHGVLAASSVVLLLISTGCQSLVNPVSGIPAGRVPRDFLAESKNDLEPINIARLRQEPPREYSLDTGDILGIYVEGVLGEVDGMPPFHMPQGRETTLPPAIGYPVPIREDGTLPLPMIPPLQVRGMTLNQVETLVRRAYTVDQQILQVGKDRIFVSLIRERTYRVVVLRQDSPQAGARRGQRGDLFDTPFSAFAAAISQTVELPAYQNDVLHALSKTGGLPGETAKNEVKILRGTLADARRWDAYVQQFYASPPADPCLCFPPLPDDPSIIRIPLRLRRGEVPSFKPEDVILQDGDVVLVESRETEVFYTAGELGGGMHQLPRDRDLNVIEAMAMVGGTPIYGGSPRGGGFTQQSMGGVPPGRLFILRQTPCEGQIVIQVDLNRAINDPSARPLVKAGDTLLLQYTPEEEMLNFGLATFWIYGIRELFR